MIIKRIFDLICVLPAVFIISPLFAVIAVWIKIDSLGPVLFRQIRVGRNGATFEILKFRTMTPNTESVKITHNTDPRITCCGRILRKYKLDELPQLVNVLKGEMSLVGPRPEVPEYVAHYPESIKSKILSVPPGLTDYAAIEFRNESELFGDAKEPQQIYLDHILPKKLAYYERYIEERSLWLDIKLIFITFCLLLGFEPRLRLKGHN